MLYTVPMCAPVHHLAALSNSARVTRVPLANAIRIEPYDGIHVMLIARLPRIPAIRLCRRPFRSLELHISETMLASKV